LTGRAKVSTAFWPHLVIDAADVFLVFRQSLPHQRRWSLIQALDYDGTKRNLLSTNQEIDGTVSWMSLNLF
jgi:hypothetical protein